MTPARGVGGSRLVLFGPRGDHAAGARLGSRGTSARRAWTRRVRSRRWCERRARSGTWASRAPAAFLAALLCGAFAVYLLHARPPALPRWTGIALVLAVGAAAHGSLDAAAARPARLHRAVVLHQRLDLPDRAGRRPGAARRQPLRARLPRAPGCERFYTRDGSVSERVREREVALEHFAYFPGAVVTRGGLAAAARARSTTTGCWCCSPRWRCCRRRCVPRRRSAGGSCSARCWCATRSPCARRGSGRTTRRACCCWCWPSRSSRGGASPGPRRRSPARSC